MINVSLKTKAKEVDGNYVLDGITIGRVTDLKPNEWFGKVMLSNVGEEFAEYGLLDPMAIVEGDDGVTYKDPKGGSDGSRGTLLEPDGTPVVNVSSFDNDEDFFKAMGESKANEDVITQSNGERMFECPTCGVYIDLDKDTTEGTLDMHLSGHGWTPEEISKVGESKANEFNVGNTVICPICNKEIDVGNQAEDGQPDYVPFDVTWAGSGTYPDSGRIEAHIQNAHKPEDFGLQDHWSLFRDDGTRKWNEAYDDWKTGNQVYDALHDSFPEFDHNDVHLYNVDSTGTSGVTMYNNQGHRKMDDFLDLKCPSCGKNLPGDGYNPTGSRRTGIR